MPSTPAELVTFAFKVLLPLKVTPLRLNVVLPDAAVAVSQVTPLSNDTFTTSPVASAALKVPLMVCALTLVTKSPPVPLSALKLTVLTEAGVLLPPEPPPPLPLPPLLLPLLMLLVTLTVVPPLAPLLPNSPNKPTKPPKPSQLQSMPSSHPLSSSSSFLLLLLLLFPLPLLLPLLLADESEPLLSLLGVALLVPNAASSALLSSSCTLACGAAGVTLNTDSWLPSN